MVTIAIATASIICLIKFYEENQRFKEYERAVIQLGELVLRSIDLESEIIDEAKFLRIHSAPDPKEYFSREKELKDMYLENYGLRIQLLEMLKKTNEITKKIDDGRLRLDEIQHRLDNYQKRYGQY